MALEKRIFVFALLITILILLSIIGLTSLLGDKREQAVVDRMDSIVKEYEDIQTIMLLSEFYGEEATCVALEKTLLNMNEDLWDLGVRIERYRAATEDFLSDPFYLEQKTDFNRKEALYFSMLKKMKSMCDVNQTIITYFYSKKETCPDCDAQAFVLSDIRRDLDNENRPDDLAVFSFDTDLDLASISLMSRVFNITEHPCIVIGDFAGVEDNIHCGLHNKAEVVELLCESGDQSFCE